MMPIVKLQTTPTTETISKSSTTRRYSIILGNLGNTRDRFCAGYKEPLDSLTTLRQAAQIPQVKGVELVGSWDVARDNVDDLKEFLTDLDLECVSIIPDLFTLREYGKGSFASCEPRIRRMALDHTREMCEIASQLGCSMLNVWPGQDGYDYLLCADYEKARTWFCEAMTSLAREFPAIRFALEYKPKEPRTHSYLARMADTLLMAMETGCENVGVSIDTGHAFVGGENVGESIVLAKRAGNRLFHMHFNDNHGCWDDDMIVGTVHSVCYLEMLYWLDRCGYAGWLSMDQYPYREDAVQAVEESILWLEQFDRIVTAHRAQMDDLVAACDPLATSRFLREVLANPPAQAL